MGMLNKFVSLIKYRNIDDKCFHMQGGIEHLPSYKDARNALLSALQQKSGRSVQLREIDIKCADNFIGWCKLVNSSYDDCNLDCEKAYQLHNNHPYFESVRCFVWENFDIENEQIGEVIASVSIGLHKTNKLVGGEFRISVDNRYKGSGTGLLLLNFAYSVLKELGVTNVECLIASKRKISYFLHRKIGLVPQFDNKCLLYSKDISNQNVIQKNKIRCRAKKYDKEFLSRMQLKYENFCNR
ncbi:GNAT family N-acetyltransferase [Butyricimonas paravirosa]|uniref:GNAT family N-acetyltransferase n=1 Tax=Butyricimonas paravirosa TaxID=1472417 RepID=UPI000E4C8313|nr:MULTISPECIES: GNAT family N-acetyltransferase [Odoribacteraceae]RGG43531.1 GNAT family N-acetyltransferase [Odoribacter sp. AF21-41]RHH88775.1 GNAT family N-acetyltransferase [Odoribacter sp. AM16-33]